jgi:selenide,water dikinase
MTETAPEIKLTQYSKGGGCGCKIAPSVLQHILQTQNKFSPENLLVGNDSHDDAAVYQLNAETAVISTTDFFMPIVDDAFDFGRIAAANAISDIYAMGGTPLMAIAILGWPLDRLPASVAQKVLEGGRAICREAGIPLAGGHTIDSQDPVFGLAVTGSVSPYHLKKNNTAKEGDFLFLTKPLGVGIMSTAQKRGVLQENHAAWIVRQMTTLNRLGETMGKIPGVHAMTDVTGFGLLGHLLEMAEGSGLSAELFYSSIKKIEGLDQYINLKTIPGATARNWSSYSSRVQFEKGVNETEAITLLPDPQTNGGLLIAVGENEVDEVKTVFQKEGLLGYADPIGRFRAASGKSVYVRP